MLAEGEFALITQHLEEALGKAVPPESLVPGADHDLYAMLADVASLQRNRERLFKYAPLAEETAVRVGHTLYQAVAHRAWGVAHTLTGEYSNAEVRLNRALSLFEELNTGWQLGRTHFELGNLFQTQNESAKARDYYSRAIEYFDSQGATLDAARTRTALNEMV